LSDFEPIPGAPYKHDYVAFFQAVASGEIDRIQGYRQMAKDDLFFLLYFGLERKDINHPWLVERIREVEELSSDTLDLWAREHYKSTILTYGLPFQRIIRNPNIRICIFSHTRPIAKGFLRQIKQTAESDPPLKLWFPDIFYARPKTQSPKWSEDDGLIFQRTSHFKEATIEGWGLVDGQPTSKHFDLRIYDDVVTEDGCRSAESIKKTIKAYEISHSLGTDGGEKLVCGTHYHHADLYMQLRSKKNYRCRIHAATVDGTPTGKPVLLSEGRLKELRLEQGPYVFACQQLLNPVADENQTFKPEWIKFYGKLPEYRNKIILVDPANEKKKDSDNTAMVVISRCNRNNRFLEDMVYDKLNLAERWRALRDLVQKHHDTIGIYYEQYGMQSDIQYFEERMEAEGIYFHITPIGGKTAKSDRIRRLVAPMAAGQFFLPRILVYEGVDLIPMIIDKFKWWPYTTDDDVLDVISRAEDPEVDIFAPVPEDAESEFDEDIIDNPDAMPGYQSFFS